VSWLQVAATAAAAIAAMRTAYERGDVDEAARRGALAGPAVVERALASSDRVTRLAAIAAAPIVEDRAELLGPLARVAGGADRRTAEAAAAAARAIAGELARSGPPDDLAAGDLAAWQAAWADLALRGDRWIEVRIAALDAAAALDPAGAGVELGAALHDPDPAFRRAAVTAVRLPAPPAAVPALAGAIAHDTDPATALDAAQALCLSLEVSASPRPILDALGPAGLARLRALVTGPPANAAAATLRDAARCLAADRSPESAAALRALRNRSERARR
jgi:hypothetical protein